MGCKTSLIQPSARRRLLPLLSWDPNRGPCGQTIFVVFIHSCIIVSCGPPGPHGGLHATQPYLSSILSLFGQREGRNYTRQHSDCLRSAFFTYLLSYCDGSQPRTASLPIILRPNKEAPIHESTHTHTGPRKSDLYAKQRTFFSFLSFYSCRDGPPTAGQDGLHGGPPRARCGAAERLPLPLLQHTGSLRETGKISAFYDCLSPQLFSLSLSL